MDSLSFCDRVAREHTNGVRDIYQMGARGGLNLRLIYALDAPMDVHIKPCASPLVLLMIRKLAQNSAMLCGAMGLWPHYATHKNWALIWAASGRPGW